MQLAAASELLLILGPKHAGEFRTRHRAAFESRRYWAEMEFTIAKIVSTKTGKWLWE